YEITRTDGTFVDGHMMTNKLVRADDGTYSGYVVLKGHIVSEQKELYDLKAKHRKTAGTEAQAEAGAEHGEHKAIQVEGSQIKAMSNYGHWHNTDTASDFTLSALHALHVIGGALDIASRWGPRPKRRITQLRRLS